MGVALVVLGWDFYAEVTGRRETMSAAYGRGDLGHPFAVGIGTAIVVCHLKRWPACLRPVDPFRLLADVTRRCRCPSPT